MNIHAFPEFIAKLESGRGAVPYATALAVWIFLSLTVWAFNRWGMSRFKKWAENSKTKFDDLLLEGLGNHLPAFLYLGAFIVSFSALSLSPTLTHLFRYVTAFWFLWAGVRLANGMLKFLIFNVWLPRHGDADLARRAHSLTPFLTVLLWGAGTIILLDNFGFKLSAIITGLGIGGVAVALASQAILGDLLSYVSILFDKPFEVGDFIVVGEARGTVEVIGIKTTRLRSLGGEQLVFSNTDLTGSRVQNFKRMQERRVLFRVGVTYDTPVNVVQQIPGLLRTIVETVPQTRFDRAHFVAFGPSSLDFEIVFYVLSPDYNVSMDVQQAINLAIKMEFDSRNVSFAFPTQTIHVAGTSALSKVL
ncbi:MAG: mechanosensitive ion channel family protein [Elusimicrobia bacterium]|nr:mechanosensitive ion channel family protein [Elusimicrobiota bacterium]